MESESNQPPLIAIVGETASGKSALALQLALQFNGEIIAADSRSIYTGLDIGTAKPTKQERESIPHHLLDVVAPNQAFTAADFKKLASKAIDDIVLRKHIPFLVGGTGLYVDSVLYDFMFQGKADLNKRRELQDLGVKELQERLRGKHIPLPENDRNPRHLIRALETSGTIAVRSPLRQHTLVLGLLVDRETLRLNIRRRIDLMIEQGFIDEVKRVADQYGWDAPALQATSYKAFRKYIAGDGTLEEAKALFMQNDLRLAKRQRTWFKRNTDIHWISKKEDAVDLITTLLNKVSTANQRSLLQ